MSVNKKLTSLLVPLVFAGCFSLASTGALAIGGSSGPAVKYPVSGKIGAVLLNPYDIAPLTAVIKNGGYQLSDVSVTVEPKEGGQPISYKVSETECRTHGGIPVFGLYPDYKNTVVVSYTKTANGKSERVENEKYRIYAAPAFIRNAGYAAEVAAFPKADVKKVAPEFQDRLYLINNMLHAPATASRAVWNNPEGGALEWSYPAQNAIYDTKGELRWYMDPSKFYDSKDPMNSGILMGFRQTDDGAFVWGYGQHYAKYDLMGRKIWNRDLPMNYNDFSHATKVMGNGHVLLRVASSDYVFPDGKKHVRTVRDVIIEVDQDGRVVDEWRLFDILDPQRTNVMQALDQGAVCLNIDASKAGQTMSEAELRKQAEQEKFGDIVGTGPGRNWAHVNSIDHDPTDDSIIISSRHQSAVIKIGRDHKVKWIMGAPAGWKGELADKVLKPVKKDGTPVKHDGSKSLDDTFDWSWTQHTGWRIPSMSDERFLYLSVFDNGDARGMEQPPLPGMKYSRAVVYKIDQKNGTVEQIWEYGKERGNEWYSPVTSITEYQKDKNSVFVYSATAGADFDMKTGAFKSMPNPYLNEFKWGDKEPSVEIQFKDAKGYQAMPVDIKKAFTH